MLNIIDYATHYVESNHDFDGFCLNVVSFTNRWDYAHLELRRRAQNGELFSIRLGIHKVGLNTTNSILFDIIEDRLLMLRADLLNTLHRRDLLHAVS